jgi:DNA-binding response OmpR family regulator
MNEVLTPAQVTTGLGGGTAVRPRVLMVALEPGLAERTARQLWREGYAVSVTASRGDALRSIERSWPDLVVLDICHYGVNDLAMFESFRACSDVPVVMLSPLADEGDRVHGLDHGADDFLPNPVSPRELAARVSSVLRRARRFSVEEVGDQVVAGPVMLSERTRQVTVRGAPVVLTALEFKLLVYFLHRPFDALDRATLLEHVWGYTIGDGSTVTVHVRRLREKIEVDPAAPTLIRTVWGTGYAFHPHPSNASHGRVSWDHV